MILSNNRYVNWLLLVIVLSDLLQIKASDYLFDLFLLLVKASNLSFNLKIGRLKKNIEKFKTLCIVVIYQFCVIFFCTVSHYKR